MKKTHMKAISAILAFSTLITYVPIFSTWTAFADEPATPILVDFSQTTTAMDSETGNYYITSSPGYTVDETKSQTGTRRKFAYGNTSALHVVVKGENGAFWPADATMKSRFTIKVQVPIASNYNIKLQGGSWFAGCIASVYIDNSYMGDYNFYNGDTTNTIPRSIGEIKRLNSIYLTAGEHSISFRSRSGVFEHPFLLLHKLFLDPIDTEPELESVTVNAPESLTVGGEAGTLTAQAMMSDNAPYHYGLKEDGTEDTENIVTVTSSNTNVVTVSNVQTVVIGGGETTTATLTAVGEGQSTITVTAVVGGVTKTTTKTVVSHVTPIIVDFSQTTTAMDSETGNYYITSSPGYTVDETKSQTGTRRKFAYGDTSALHVVVKGESGAFWPADATMKSRFTIKVQVPIASNYNMKLQGGSWLSGCVASVYIDNSYMGDYNFYNDDTNKSIGENKRLNSIYLTAGEHSISFRSRVAYCNYPYLLLHKLFLDPIAAKPELESIKTDIPEVLALGETINASIQAMMSDGMPYCFGLTEEGAADTVNYMTATNSNQSVATLSPLEVVKIGDGANATTTITPVCTGQTIITVTTKVDGVTQTRESALTVTNEQLDKVEVTLNADEVFIDDVIKIIPINILDSGRVIRNENVQTTFESETPTLATIEGDILTAKQCGTARIKATSQFNGKQVIGYLNVEILPEGMTRIEATAGASNYVKLADVRTIHVKAFSNKGNEMDLSAANITFQSLTPGIATVDENGLITPLALGEAKIAVIVELAGRTRSMESEFSIVKGKVASTIYTMEKRAIAVENASTYDWAIKIRNDFTESADEYVNIIDQLWGMIPYEGIPRAVMIGLKMDPNGYTCPCCHTDLRREYGTYPWLVDPLNPEIGPWKIKCPNPACGKKFPTNDFASFYQLGLDEHGVFHSDLAHQKNDVIIANGGTGYLVNVLYPEMGEGWGVDDGFGYVTGDIADNGLPETKTFIAYYQHFGLWDGGLIQNALEVLQIAYLYSGDIKYGRAGAILIDKIADVYPSYDLALYAKEYPNIDGGGCNGKILGCIWENRLAVSFARAYDAFYPAMDDPTVIQFLSQKAQMYNLDNKKTCPQLVRQNCEDGILREIYKSATNAKILGNFGMVQQSVAETAVVLDSLPETKEMLDWIGNYSVVTNENGYNIKNTGGNLLSQFINLVDRDGTGNEVGALYNQGWFTDTIGVAEALYGYDTDSEIDLYNNPKYMKMFTSLLPLIMVKKYTAQIGDSGNTAKNHIYLDKSIILTGFIRTGIPELAQIYYFLNGKTVEGTHADVFTDDPEDVQQDIINVINQYGEINLKSENRTGYGLAVLRDVALNDNATVDTQRDFWMYYGRTNTSHAHVDKLNLGIDAYGFNMAPDLGYPAATSSDPNRLQWVKTTLSHNTVIVDEKQQNSNYDATPLHFDDFGKVKVMDVDAKDCYPATSIYRRTLVMIEANDEVSYGVDFFRIKGGKDHLYSFHTQSDNVTEVTGVNLIQQNGGSYAGEDVPWGNDPNTNTDESLMYPRGYTWLKNVRKDLNPASGVFSINFKQTDFRNVLPYEMDLNLRLTMLNDWKLDEVSICEGDPPITGMNPESLEYVLARHRSDSELDTLFTTVLEPYNGSRYIANMVSVPLIATEGTPGSDDTAKAIKITHTSGKVDYVVYATNNTVKYRIDNVFDFRGFIGVYTIENSVPVYTYLNDGDLIGTMVGTPAATGEIVDFTQELAWKNSITVDFDAAVDLDALAGRYIYINNDKVQNSVYKIHGATYDNDGNVVLDINDVTLIRQYKVLSDVNSGYAYNIAVGQSFKIPFVSMSDD